MNKMNKNYQKNLSHSPRLVTDLTEKTAYCRFYHRILCYINPFGYTSPICSPYKNICLLQYILSLFEYVLYLVVWIWESVQNYSLFSFFFYFSSPPPMTRRGCTGEGPVGGSPEGVRTCPWFTESSRRETAEVSGKPAGLPKELCR